MAVKIAFVNNKGGSAKTTTMANIAGALCNRFPDKKILIVEGDAQGNATTSFGKKPSDIKMTIYDVFMGTVAAKDVILNAWQNIDIIPANADMNFLEFDVMTRFDEEISVSFFEAIQELKRKGVDLNNITQEQVANEMPRSMSPTNSYFNMLNGKLKELDKKYDVILFDTPPELKAVTSSILAICDKAIIPFEPDVFALDGITNILARINEIKKEFNNKLEVAGVLAVKVKKNTKLHTDIRNAIMKFCMKNGYLYFDHEIPNTVRFASSVAIKRIPSTLSKPDDPFSQAYYGVLNEMLKHKIIDWGGK